MNASSLRDFDFWSGLALAPAVLFAQAAAPAQQPTAQPPATQTPGAAPAQPATPPPPKLGLTSPPAVLLVPIKPDQTAVFEEFAGKLKAGLAKSQDPMLQQQAAGFKIYKSAEPFGANALYVVYDRAGRAERRVRALRDAHRRR